MRCCAVDDVRRHGYTRKRGEKAEKTEEDGEDSVTVVVGEGKVRRRGYSGTCE